MATENKLVTIRLKRSVAGRFAGDGFSYGAGAIVAVDPRLAADLCRGENAELFLPPAGKETATAKQQNKETR
ncbi:MAG: hypothetical protein E6R03_08190 [Hyphomicrobiaceae bacterium]|nr:MAG: hypothetical protein E6R03_08190 [Hyphomicrobiaceae bacterium]